MLEALPPEPLDEIEVTPTGSRYDGQVMVFGKKLQVLLAHTKSLLGQY